MTASGQRCYGSGVVEQRVAARMERQQVLSRDDPPLLWTIIGEVALRASVGGREVMRAQLARLVEAASPRVIIQVLPLRVPAHPDLTGQLELLARDGKPDIAYIEMQGKAQLIDRPSEVDHCALLYDMMRAEALAPGARALIADIAEKEHA